MRISDWSSDVCSSDLRGVDVAHRVLGFAQAALELVGGQFALEFAAHRRPLRAPAPHPQPGEARRSEERRVGKECVIRVDLGGRRTIKKNKTRNTSYPIIYFSVDLKPDTTITTN